MTRRKRHTGAPRPLFDKLVASGRLTGLLPSGMSVRRQTSASRTLTSRRTGGSHGPFMRMDMEKSSYTSAKLEQRP